MKKLSNRIILYVLIIITLVILINIFKFEKTSAIGSANEVVYSLHKEGDFIKSNFNIPYNDFNKIGIRFATYMKSNIQGEMNIKLYDLANDEKIYDENIDISKIQDNQFFMIRIPTQKDSIDKEYSLEMTLNEIEDDSQLGIYGYISEDDKKDVGLEYGFKDIEKGFYNYILYFIGFILVMETLLNFNEKGGKKNNGSIRKTRKLKNKN